MLILEKTLTLDQAAISSSNLVDQFEEGDLDRIGIECHGGYIRDEFSRTNWMKRNEAGMDLALQIQKDKTFPWPGCANVTFPLVTIAAMQFHARAYPAIVNGTDIVKCTVLGDAPEAVDQAKRVSTHMSWQRLYQDKSWEEQEDKSILNLSIIGTNFKKTYRSASLGYDVSELVLAKNLVLDYWAKSVEDCPRKTHKMPMFRNELHEKVLRGTFRDCLEEPWYPEAPPPERTVAQINEDKRQGIEPPPPDTTTSFMVCEQHVNLDLDKDGYAEPYIVTFEETSKYVLRIVTRFDSLDDIERVAEGPRKDKIVHIESMEYFTKRTFIPSPDGGIYDIGFGVLLGPLNEGVDSLINMLLDSGTMQTTSGGFLGRGAKFRGGIYTMAPFEWKRVDSSGDDLRKNLVPLVVNEPSNVLFQLLGLLIDYTSRVSGTTDITIGENPGQNTPAQTSQNMIEMGQKIYSAIFKRIWRSSKEEFTKLFKLNSMFLPLDVQTVGGATRSDYLAVTPDQISPVADPNITSDSMQMNNAMALKAAAASTPGYNTDEVERRFLRAMHTENIDQVFQGTEGQPPPEDPKVTIEKMKIAGRDAETSKKIAAEMQQFVMKLQEDQRVNNAKIMELQANAMEAAANAQSEESYAQVALINAQISMLKMDNDQIEKRIEQTLKMVEIESRYALEMRKTEKKEAVN